MKKWMLLGILFMAIMIGIVVNVYLNAVEPVSVAEKKAVEIAAKETNLSDFTDFKLYSGEETYYVMTGKNAGQEDVYVWINEKNGDLITKVAKNGITQKEALTKLYQEKQPDEIIAIRLGMSRIQMTDRPAWEIYYRKNSGTINYYYVDFETGEKLRAIDNL